MGFAGSLMRSAHCCPRRFNSAPACYGHARPACGFATAACRPAVAPADRCFSLAIAFRNRKWHRLRDSSRMRCTRARIARGQLPTAFAQPLVAPPEALSPAEQQKKFHLPPGFEIQLFASEPAIHKPINFSFDSQGRLFVTDTLEYPYPAKDPARRPRHASRFWSTAMATAVPTKSRRSSTGSNIPLGVMPIPGGVIVYSIPTCSAASTPTATARPTRASRCTPTSNSATPTAWSTRSPAGSTAGSTPATDLPTPRRPQGSDGQRITMNSGNTFRMRLDGSHVEYFTHGQVNPFGLAFDPLGNLYSADCHTMPIYMLLRGAYYPSFGKAHDGLGFGPDDDRPRPRLDRHRRHRLLRGRAVSRPSIATRS